MLAIARRLGFPLHTIIFSHVSTRLKNIGYARESIDSLIDEMAGKAIKQPDVEKTRKNLLAMFALVHGREVSGEALNELLTAYSYNRSRLLALVSFVKGESAGVATICDALNIAGAKASIMEIYELIHQRKSFLSEITEKVGLEPKQFEIVKATVYFLSCAAELAVFIRDNQEVSPVELYFCSLKDFEQSHYLLSLSHRLMDAFDTFYRFDVLRLITEKAEGVAKIGELRVLKDLERLFDRKHTEAIRGANKKAKLFMMFLNAEE